MSCAQIIINTVYLIIQTTVKKLFVFEELQI